MRRIIIALVMMLSSSVVAQEPFSAAWWNVENLFDLRDDPHTNDDEFTPQGERHWTGRRMWAKLEGIAKTLAMMDLPDVVGLGEVENKYVLRELCQGTAISPAGYRYVHYDSPDRRGIDVALIYRADRFTVDSSRRINVSDSTKDFYTRDILEVVGHTPAGDTVCLLLNHWPSKRGGDEAEAQRLRIADTLRRHMLELHGLHPTAAVIAMGDMNSTADEEAIVKGMRFGNDTVSADGIRLLTQRLPLDMGSHKYQGEWRYIDQVFLLADESWVVKKLKLPRFDHLLTADGGRIGQRPKRTYQGVRYEGGLSDHLPLLLRIAHTK